MSIFGLRTSNPVFKGYFWKNSRNNSKSKMSIKGILIKSFFMLSLVVMTATYTWHLFFNGVNIKWYTAIGMFVAIFCSLLISFKHSAAKYLLPIYALAKGLFLGGISAIAHHQFPNLPFQYDFIDEEYAEKFAAEERVASLARVFTMLAILISCLGLFGLASFVAEQRTKEIGVRKVLGATVSNLWMLLSKDFVKLVIISF